MKISVRTDYLFEKESVEDQIKFAKEAGADAVEFGEMLDYDCTKAAAVAAQCGIPFLACGFYDMWNCRLGDTYEKIKKNLLKTIDCAETLGCKFLLGLSVDSPDRSEQQKARFVENMKPVAELLEKHNLVALIEPHNTILPNPVFDFSHYFVNTNAMGNQLIAQINSPSVQLLFDVYHEQIMTGNLFATVEASQVYHCALSFFWYPWSRRTYAWRSPVSKSCCERSCVRVTQAISSWSIFLRMRRNDL